jgi:hypothetical protein
LTYPGDFGNIADMNHSNDFTSVQIYFCHICGGPGIHRDEGKLVCAFHFKLSQFWNAWPRALSRLPKNRRRNRKNPPMEETWEYQKKRIKFLTNNDIDVVSLLVLGRFVRAITVHHTKGRGPHYLDEESWIATTPPGDKWCHNHPELARELGFLQDPDPQPAGKDVEKITCNNPALEGKSPPPGISAEDLSARPTVIQTESCNDVWQVGAQA